MNKKIMNPWISAVDDGNGDYVSWRKFFDDELFEI